MNDVTHNLLVAAKFFLFASIAVVGLAMATEFLEMLTSGGVVARDSGTDAG